MAQSRRDAPVRPPRLRTAADLAMLRLPVGLFGYREDATDAAFDAAARLIAEQQAEIARLRAEAWRLRSQRDADGAAPPASEAPQRRPETDAAQSPPDAGSADAGSPTTGSPPTGAQVLPSPDPVGGQT